MEGRSISISCVGDKEFQRALKSVAAEKGVRVADIVREALDSSVHAQDIISAMQRSRRSFFTSNAELNPQRGENSAIETV